MPCCAAADCWNDDGDSETGEEELAPGDSLSLVDVTCGSWITLELGAGWSAAAAADVGGAWEEEGAPVEDWGSSLLAATSSGCGPLGDGGRNWPVSWRIFSHSVARFWRWWSYEAWSNCLWQRIPESRKKKSSFSQDT